MSLVCSGTSSKFQHCLLSGTPSIHSSHRRSAPPHYGLAHSHPIESAIVRHEEGNEGEKIGVKRRFAAFYGAKLLKIIGSKIQRNPPRNQRTSTPAILIARTGNHCASLICPFPTATWRRWFRGADRRFPLRPVLDRTCPTADCLDSWHRRGRSPYRGCHCGSISRCRHRNAA